MSTATIDKALVTAATYMLMVRRDSPAMVAAYLAAWVGDMTQLGIPAGDQEKRFVAARAAQRRSNLALLK